MKFCALLSLATLGTAAALAVREPDSSKHLDLPDLSTLALFPPPARHSVKNETGLAHPRDVETHSGLRQDFIYRLGGWVFTIGQYNLNDYQNVNGWVLPTNGIDIDYLAGQVADAIRAHTGTGDLDGNVGGGWSYFISLAQNYQFQNIPYSVLWGTITLAIQCANDWITWENAVYFQTVDTNGIPIFVLEIWPTVHGAMTSIHDEF